MKPILTNLTDEDLYRLLRRGDEGAFTVLYRRRQGSIYRFALQMSGDPAVAEEVTQEVFLALIRGTGQFDVERGNLQSWLFGAARNQVRKLLDRGWRHVPIDNMPEDETGVLEPVANGNILEQLTRQELLEAVRQSVLSLPPHYREAVVLCDLQELSYEQASHVLGCAVGTVRSRLNRGRAMLAERLQEPVGNGA